MDYYNKYLKYKNKYLELKKQMGSRISNEEKCERENECNYLLHNALPKLIETPNPNVSKQWKDIKEYFNKTCTQTKILEKTPNIEAQKEHKLYLDEIKKYSNNINSIHGVKKPFYTCSQKK